MSLKYFEFCPKVYSFDCDLFYYKFKTLQNAMEICLKHESCIGFNTRGYFKFYIRNQQDRVNLTTASESEGLYIHKKRYQEIMLNDEAQNLFKEYEFYPGKDSMGHDIGGFPNLTILELKYMADKIPNCKAFNTFGFLKTRVSSPDNLVDMYQSDIVVPSHGIYVKKNPKKINST